MKPNAKFKIGQAFRHRVALNSDFIASGVMGILGVVALFLYCALPAKESL